MMGGKTPETYSAVNKRQDNKLEKMFASGLVIYLNCTMMHGITNLKYRVSFQNKFPKLLHLVAFIIKKFKNNNT